ncbi:MAG: circadian clock KaiB family protein [Chloroflexota bacterium]|nr:circadian clock KaiB family protein [Chloroflexota bacterium]
MAAETTLQRLERALAELREARYELTLFVSGQSASSARAVRNVKALCEAHLNGRYNLTIVDVNQNPELARGSRVLATPTLVKGNPAPERMLVGDLSDSERVLLALDVRVVGEDDAEAAVE